MANTYSTSDGKRLTTSQIDSKIRLSKALKLEMQFVEHGYNFCEKCGKNAINTYLDVSHTVSVKKAKETGNAEIAYDLDNLKILCRKCHAKHDKLNLRFNDTINKDRR